MGTKRPILFSAPMVLAILEGRKTQTRRLATNKSAARIQSGDTLWVREAWAPADFMVNGGYNLEDPVAVAYRADRQVLVHDRKPPWPADTSNWNWDHPGWKWKPSIFMPRWACRIELHATDVRVESLHDITEAQATAEGVDCDIAGPLLSFACLWDSINDGYGIRWFDNPEVRVIEFEVQP